MDIYCLSVLSACKSKLTFILTRIMNLKAELLLINI
jgi:hypothetical protein